MLGIRTAPFPEGKAFVVQGEGIINEEHVDLTGKYRTRRPTSRTVRKITTSPVPPTTLSTLWFSTLPC